MAYATDHTANVKYSEHTVVIMSQFLSRSARVTVGARVSARRAVRPAIATI